MKYFGVAVKSTIPVSSQWEFAYSNWWGDGEEVRYFGTEEECRKEQEHVEQWGFTAFCSGYGPDRALTIYIGPRRKGDNKWELEYHNWWGKGAYRIFLGTEEECRGEQGNVEAAGWDMYCQGYGPSQAITIYIGPRRKLTYDLFNFSQKILKDSSPQAYAKWEKDYEEYTLTDQGQSVGCGFGPDPRDYM